MNGAITTEFDPDAQPERGRAAARDRRLRRSRRRQDRHLPRGRQPEPTVAGAWGDTPLHVALLDLGCKNNIVRCLQDRLA